ncbi:DUF397 domain-containing protein [Streptomyces axinellae]|uniref:DUF397 domain-containing protein n=1 Tax=Streptomyces axinellae TaxID=552788 RepID=A0ABP6DBA8_9ACTN
MISSTSLPCQAWRKSTYSSNNGGNCLEVADDFVGAVPVRDSKVSEGAVLLVPAGAWSAFIATVRDGGFVGG